MKYNISLILIVRHAPEPKSQYPFRLRLNMPIFVRIELKPIWKFVKHMVFMVLSRKTKECPTSWLNIIGKSKYPINWNDYYIIARNEISSISFLIKNVIIWQENKKKTGFKIQNFFQNSKFPSNSFISFIFLILFQN